MGELEKMISRFPAVVEKAGNAYEPHHLTIYLTELASAFNAYYAQHTIVNKEDVFSPYRVAITKAFAITMKQGMWLLGIPVLEKM